MKRRFTWTDEARADLRGIRKEQALGILKALTRFAEVRHTAPSRSRLRESCRVFTGLPSRDREGAVEDIPCDELRFAREGTGDYRVFFRFEKDDTIHVLSVENRREAYR